jgi:hypothetical protein
MKAIMVVVALALVTACGSGDDDEVAELRAELDVLREELAATATSFVTPPTSTAPATITAPVATGPTTTVFDASQYPSFDDTPSFYKCQVDEGELDIYGFAGLGWDGRLETHPWNGMTDGEIDADITRRCRAKGREPVQAHPTGTAPPTSVDPPHIDEDCTFDGRRLWGNVLFVDSKAEADLSVFLTNQPATADIWFHTANHYTRSSYGEPWCGVWQTALPGNQTFFSGPPDFHVFLTYDGDPAIFDQCCIFESFVELGTREDADFTAYRLRWWEGEGVELSGIPGIPNVCPDPNQARPFEPTAPCWPDG